MVFFFHQIFCNLKATHVETAEKGVFLGCKSLSIINPFGDTP